MTSAAKYAIHARMTRSYTYVCPFPDFHFDLSFVIEQTMPCSLIGRHALGSNQLENLVYWIHSFLVIPAVFIVGLQVLTVFPSTKQSPAIHRKSGLTFPLVVLTGAALTMHSYVSEKTHLVPVPSIFLCYGFSYTTIGMETLGYITPSRRWMHWTGVLIWANCIYQLAMLRTIISFELFVLLYPLKWVHLSQFSRRTSHGLKGLSLNYLGLLGTAFTVSYDKYWIFPRTGLPLIARMAIQNIPVGIWLYSFSRRRTIIPKHPVPKAETLRKIKGTPGVV